MVSPPACIINDVALHQRTSLGPSADGEPSGVIFIRPLNVSVDFKRKREEMLLQLLPTNSWGRERGSISAGLQFVVCFFCFRPALPLTAEEEGISRTRRLAQNRWPFDLRSLPPPPPKIIACIFPGVGDEGGEKTESSGCLSLFSTARNDRQ